MVFGTFDILHPGHLHLFRQARNYGDVLYVVLARDETVKQYKDYTPEKENERKERLLTIPFVDEVILGDAEDRMKPLRDIKPDVVCLGYDQALFVDLLEHYIDENRLDITVVRLQSYEADRYKSSKFRQ